MQPTVSPLSTPCIGLSFDEETTSTSTCVSAAASGAILTFFATSVRRIMLSVESAESDPPQHANSRSRMALTHKELRRAARPAHAEAAVLTHICRLSAPFNTPLLEVLSPRLALSRDRFERLMWRLALSRERFLVAPKACATKAEADAAVRRLVQRDRDVTVEAVLNQRLRGLPLTASTHQHGQGTEQSLVGSGVRS